ncbi:hypothetical protein Sjap_000009 [Stephania japonica]|uniref:B box-type domain-containing protein n=1 Tax=Stephania japonica TaxID=461633 RepID=A0AAP0PS21_9MAGN
MKIQCNVCEAVEANVLCCADEAALCWACDEKVHAANKLASKHQRVSLSGSSSQMPKCDICQFKEMMAAKAVETVGYFFCLEDRALLCRKCDVAIHTVNSYVSGHQRFLLTGVKRSVNSVSMNGGSNEVSSHQDGRIAGVPATKISFSGGTMAGNIPEWPLDDFLGLPDFNQSYGFPEHGSSKADSGKLGDSDSSPFSRAAYQDLEVDDECLVKVPEMHWQVPEIPSPPTASGLFWPKVVQNPHVEDALFVPDKWGSSPSNNSRYPSEATAAKRRRQC